MFISVSRIIYMYINTYILYGTILMAGAAYIYIYICIIQYMYLRLHERAEEGESDLNADEE